MFISGKSLPYTEYSDESIEQILQYKKNNLAASIAVLDGIVEYANDKNTPTTREAINLLIDELSEFALNGLFAIGFYGISVEDGKPIRVDSLGKNISKRYDSVYLDMTEAEYLSLDRIDSMILDQKEMRKFMRYLAWYKSKISDTLVPILSMESLSTWTDEAKECRELDDLFKNILRKTSRYAMNSGSALKKFTTYDAIGMAERLMILVEPWKEKLKKDKNIVSPSPYTPTEIFKRIEI